MAGCYSYLWSKVLVVDVADYFNTHSALKPEVDQASRDKVLSQGSASDPMQMFRDFTSLRAPDTRALLKARGL